MGYELCRQRIGEREHSSAVEGQTFCQPGPQERRQPVRGETLEKQKVRDWERMLLSKNGQ